MDGVGDTVARLTFNARRLKDLDAMGRGLVSLSGFVNVYFEKVLKSRVANLSIWDRNVQLAIYSIPCYFTLVLQSDNNIFNAWTLNAGILAVLGGAGGLLVAFTMKYTNTIIKTFATSGAIILTAFAGHVFLGAPLDIPIGIGGCCTVLSLMNYNDEGSECSIEPEEKENNLELVELGSLKNFVGGPTPLGGNNHDKPRALIDGMDVKSDQSV